MKKSISIKYIFLILIYVALFTATLNKTYSQDTAKHKVRLKADYFKIMNGDNYIDIGAISKIKKENINVSNIELSVYNNYYDEKIEIGTVKTNMKGESRFYIKDLSTLKPDSSNTYNLSILFKGNDSYKKATKKISFKDVIIEASIITKDSINYVTASLKEKATDSIISGESLDVQVERLFRPLKIGEQFNYTNDKGSIMVPVEYGIPGVDGILTLEVVLLDHDDYGTVKALVSDTIGIPIKEESTFDERTMWSPRNKTPYFLLIVPNLLTFGMWIIIFYLMFNLYKIRKS